MKWLKLIALVWFVAQASGAETQVYKPGDPSLPRAVSDAMANVYGFVPLNLETEMPREKYLKREANGNVLRILREKYEKENGVHDSLPVFALGHCSSFFVTVDREQRRGLLLTNRHCLIGYDEQIERDFSKLKSPVERISALRRLRKLKLPFLLLNSEDEIVFDSRDTLTHLSRIIPSSFIGELIPEVGDANRFNRHCEAVTDLAYGQFAAGVSDFVAFDVFNLDPDLLHSLPISAKKAEMGETVYGIGYPDGSPQASIKLKVENPRLTLADLGQLIVKKTNIDPKFEENEKLNALFSEWILSLEGGLQHGMSGGPLVNDKGELVGLITKGPGKKAKRKSSEGIDMLKLLKLVKKFDSLTD